MRDIDVHSPLEKFAVPHQFQPRLSWFGAFVAVGGSLARIFLGSLIGALWGVQIWIAFASEHSMIWKSFAVFGLAAGLAASIGALMWGIGKATMKLDQRITLSK
jgi:hypothetical protein